MALSTPPPPLDAAPSSSTTNRPPFPPDPQNPTPHPHSNPPSHYPAPPFYSPHLLNSILPSNCNPNYPHPHDAAAAATASARHYAVASSCRGFLPKQPPSVTLINLDPNSHIYMCRPGGASYPKPVFGYSHHPDPGQGPGGLGMGMGYVSGRATTHLQHPGAAAVMPGVIKGVPVSGASSQSQHLIALSSTSISDCNGQKEIRDDSVVTMKDWKVRVSDNASVYALCRSWLRNGLSEESQCTWMQQVLFQDHCPYQPRIVFHH